MISWLQCQRTIPLRNSCTSNNQVFPQGDTKCNFDCYTFNYSLIALKPTYAIEY